MIRCLSGGGRLAAANFAYFYSRKPFDVVDFVVGSTCCMNSFASKYSIFNIINCEGIPSLMLSTLNFFFGQSNFLNILSTWNNAKNEYFAVNYGNCWEIFWAALVSEVILITLVCWSHMTWWWRGILWWFRYYREEDNCHYKTNFQSWSVGNICVAWEAKTIHRLDSHWIKYFWIHSITFYAFYFLKNIFSKTTNE